MLTLERREGESIYIIQDNKTIEISVKLAKDGKTKLSFDAPAEATIIRGELLSKTGD